MTFPLLYAESLDFTKFVRNVLNVAIAFAFCALVHALITYIAMIKSKISALMLENLGLLDGMYAPAGSSPARQRTARRGWLSC